MRKILFFGVLFLNLLSSCGGSNEQELVAVGGKVYGGEFKFMSSEKVDNLFPMSSADVYAQRISMQIFEPLLKIDVESMEVVPSIAESYTVSEDAKVFTFKIRKGVKFHDDECFGGEGREVTAEDVKYTLDYACSGLSMNKMSYLLGNRIMGARDFFLKSKKSLPKEGVRGIKVIDQNTLEINLVEAFVGFDKILSHTNLGIIAREAVEKYGKDIKMHPVGTGPFMLEKMDKDGVVLKRNAHYWKKDELGNQLPFLDKVTMIYAKDKKSELLAFRNRQVDLVLEIPVEEIDHILGSLQDAQAGKNVKHRVDSRSSMSMSYIALACQSDEFKDVRVRKALNMAINRNEIVDKNLLGEGWAATNGFVPQMDDYLNEKVKGHPFNVAKALALLAEAGYPNGKNFPVLDFYVNAIEGSAPHKMCVGVADQLKRNLNITLNIKLCTLEEREKAIEMGIAKIWRTGWIADYPDAENFLSIFYSGGMNSGNSVINSFKYSSDAYNALFDKAVKEKNDKERNSMFVKLDQMIIDEAPVIPVLTDDFMVMINARIREFHINSMEQLDFSEIYIKEPRTK